MSIWDKLPTTRDWDGAESRYPTWESIDGITWRTLETGYVYTLPTIGAISNTMCFVGESFVLNVEMSEKVEPEDGGAALETGEPFTGTVKAIFQGSEVTLSYNQESGLFSGTLQGPPESAWSEDEYTFSGMVTAVNERGTVTKQFSLVAYKAFPEIVSVSAADSIKASTFILSAVLRISTVPETKVDEAIPLFSGTATAYFQSASYSLSKVSGDVWMVSIPSPNQTSWWQPNHVYSGTLTAAMGELSVSEDFGARVRETTPPSITLLMPSQDLFICNDCSPLWRWYVADDESGVSHATVTIDGGAEYLTELYDDIVCWQMPVLPTGIYEVTVYVTDHDDNTSSFSKTVTGFPLVFDRSESDVALVRSLNNLGWSDMSDDERIWWLNGNQDRLIRGAYNTSDMNRVETATKYLARRCAQHDASVTIKEKTDWNVADVPVESDLERYLSNVVLVVNKFERLKAEAIDYYQAFTEPPLDLPEKMASLNFNGANAIEWNLVYINKLIAWIECVEWYAETHTVQTWEEVEGTYLTWEGIDGESWFDVQFPVIIESDLIPPWEVMPLGA